MLVSGLSQWLVDMRLNAAGSSASVSQPNPPDGIACVAAHEGQPEGGPSRHAAQHGQRVCQRHLSAPQEAARLDHFCTQCKTRKHCQHMLQPHFFPVQHRQVPVLPRPGAHHPQSSHPPEGFCVSLLSWLVLRVPPRSHSSTTSSLAAQTSRNTSCSSHTGSALCHTTVVCLARSSSTGREWAAECRGVAGPDVQCWAHDCTRRAAQIVDTSTTGNGNTF